MHSDIARPGKDNATRTRVHYRALKQSSHYFSPKPSERSDSSISISNTRLRRRNSARFFALVTAQSGAGAAVCRSRSEPSSPQARLRDPQIVRGLRHRLETFTVRAALIHQLDRSTTELR